MFPLPHPYYLLHKPHGILSQFRGGHPGLRQLGDLGYNFPPGIHAVGRLDYESEGLLLLTTDNTATRRLFEGPALHPRSYLVQVYKPVSKQMLERLRSGIQITIKNGMPYTTPSIEIERTAPPPWLPPSPEQLRADIRQDWLQITLCEGKYRQVRKMVRAAGHPCHRLVRTAIGGHLLEGLAAGALREMGEADFWEGLSQV